MEDYKEKLRLAKEALDSDSYDKETIEYIFPELKESKDECIRKELIRAFTVTADKRSHEIYGNGITYGQVLAWLEKQGVKIDAIENFDTEFEKQVSHLIASTINKEHEYNQSYVKRTANALLNYAKHELEKQVEQKPAWSEEDDRMFKLCTSSVKTRYIDGLLTCNEYEQASLWLKSLKERYTWKPSDEQMEALLKLEEMHVLEHEKNQENAHLYMVIKSLREQLLKLKKGE